jgi:hypothetical protein
MTVEDRIIDHLHKHSRQVYCDDCLADLLQLKRRQQAQRVTSCLASKPGFTRISKRCSECDKVKLVAARTD